MTRQVPSPFFTLIFIRFPVCGKSFATAPSWSRRTPITLLFFTKQRICAGQDPLLYRRTLLPALYSGSGLLQSAPIFKAYLAGSTAPSASPNYAVLFLSEVRPLIPEVLTTWMTRLSGALFGSPFSAAIARTPTREEAQAHWKKEQSGLF